MASAAYAAYAQRSRHIQHTHAKKNTSRSIKNTFEPLFFGFLEGKFELNRRHMANAAERKLVYPDKITEKILGIPYWIY